MDSNEIATALLHDPITRHQFRGVYAADELTDEPGYVIVNTDPSRLPGSHWIALYKTGRTYEVFDSYGFSPKKYGGYIRDYFANKTYHFNPVRLQGDWSSTCGHFCVHYVLMKCRGNDMNAIVKGFDKTDFTFNDRYVVTHFNQRYQAKQKVYDVPFLKRQLAKSMSIVVASLQ